MKKSLFLATCAATGMLAVSCSQEARNMAADDPADQSLTFVFSGLGKGPVTYAIATDDENQVDDLDVYMFEYAADQEGAFKKRFTSGEYSLTKNGTQHTLKLDNLHTYGETPKTFYFVANPSPTTALDATGKTEKVFAESLTEQVQVVGEKGELLSAPLLFTGKTAQPVNPNGSTSETVPMTRRVARFDIVNAYDNFVIEKVFVSDAKLQGYAFGNAKKTGAPVFPVKSLREIAVSDPACYETIGSERIAQHVFYLYPTRMGETTIAIQANLNGQGSELYYVDSDLEIKPNFRYKMTVDPAIAFGTVKLILDYADWDTDQHMDVDQKKAFLVENYKVDGSAAHANWDAAKNTYDLNGSSAAKLTFDVRNSLEVKEQITLIEGDWGDVKGGALGVSKTSVLTYGAEMVHNYEITLPEPADDGGGYFAVRLRVSNKANEAEFEDIYITRLFELPNAYIVYTGDEVEFPVRKAYTVWEKQFNTTLTGAVTAEVVWQDSPDGAVVTDVSVPADLGPASKIVVRTGGTAGNALVALKVNGEIGWTWHIWACANADDPRTNTAVVTHLLGQNTFMDRNLGATASTPGTPGAIGLYYQWGRHTPFPGPKAVIQDGVYDSRPIYRGTTGEALTHGTPDGGTGVNMIRITESNNIPNAIRNPLTFYLGVSENGYNWHTMSKVHSEYLWYHADNSKGYFDPCPEGWRTPRMTDLEQSDYPWYELSELPTIPTYAEGTGPDFGAQGAYPAGGYIHLDGKFTAVGKLVNAWGAGLVESSDRTYYGGCFVGFYSGMFAPWNFPFQACGMPVRCVKDEYPL